MLVKFEGQYYSLKEIIFTDCLDKNYYSICWEGYDLDGEEYHIYSMSTTDNPKSPEEVDIQEVVPINNNIEWDLWNLEGL